MSGELDLEKSLTVSPQLVKGEFVFCSFQGNYYGDHAHLRPIGAFSEPEGLTLIIPRSKADLYGVNYALVFKCITLGVHSSLDAIGLTAAFSSRLADCGISANVIAGYHHDHVFVLREHAQRAVEVLAAVDFPST